MIKIINKLDKEETYIKPIKVMFDKSIANIILDSERLKSFSL